MLKIKSLFVRTGVILLITLTIAADAPKLVKTKVNDRITAYIPSGWIPMDPNDLVQRYPSVRAPLAAYTNMERTIDFAVNISATQWPDGNLEMSQKFFKASIMNMFDRVEMISEGIHAVGKKKMIFFEFESRVEGRRANENLKDPVMKYTYIQYLVEPDRTLVFSFNCPRRDREEWQETARTMMKKLAVK